MIQKNSDKKEKEEVIGYKRTLVRKKKKRKRDTKEH